MTEKKKEVVDYEGLHTCSYACMRPGCIEYQRNELFRKLEAERAVNAALKEVIDKLVGVK